MNTIRTIIIDDEPAAVDSINELARHLATDIQVVAIAGNGLEGFQKIIEIKPDLVYLDVDLPMMNGLQVMEKLPQGGAEVIVTTGSLSYASKALRLGAIGYLVKPIDPSDFLLTLEKVRKRLAEKTQSAS